MGIFDARLDLSRRLADYRPQVTTLSDVLYGTPQKGSTIQVPQLSAAARAGDPLGDLRKQASTMFTDLGRQQKALEIAQGQANAPLTGWKGLLADVLDNPVTKVALKPLEILDIPRRVIISGIQEVADAFNGGDASWNDFWDQAKDPSFGFGDVIGGINPNDKWGNRVLGFLGDVLLDPLTYVSFGASKAAKVLGESGKAGRVALAERLVAAGASTERGIEIARKGRAFLTAEEAASVGLDRVGLYFMGKRIKGTGKVAELLQKPSAKMRIVLGDTMRGQKVAAMFDPQDVSAARRALLNGTVPEGLAADYFNIIKANDFKRAAFAAHARDGAKGLEDLLNSLGIEDVRSVQNTVYKVMEKSGEAVSATEQKVADGLTAFLDDLWAKVDGVYKEIDPEGGFGQVENYFPHMRTADAVKYMSNPDNPHVSELRSIIENPIETVGAFKHRLREGDTFFGHTLTEEDIAGGVERLNQIAADGGFKAGQFFETDVMQVMSKYLGQHAEQMGVAAYMKSLFESGSAQRIIERQTLDEKALAQVQKLISKQADQFEKSMSKTLKGVTEAQGRVGKILTAQMEGVREAASDVAEYTSNAWRTFNLTSAERDDVVRQLDDALNSLTEAHGAYKVVFEDTEEPMLLTDLRARLDGAREKLQEARDVVASQEALNAQDQQRIADGFKMLEDAVAQERTIREHGNRIERGLQMIASGKRIEDVELPQKVRTALRRAFDSEMQIKGTMADVIPQTRQTQQWWKNLTETVKIADKEIKLSEAEVGQIVTAAARGDATIREMRAASLYMLARQAWIADGIENVPAIMRDTIESMIREGGTLQKAELAEKFFKNFDRAEKQFATWRRMENVYSNARKVAEEVDDQIFEYIAARKLIDRFAQRGMTDADRAVVVTGDELSRMLVNEYEPLRPLFARWIDDTGEATNFEQMMLPAGEQGNIISVGQKKTTIPMADTEAATADPSLAAAAAQEAALTQEAMGRAVPQQLTLGDIEDALKNLKDQTDDRWWDVEVMTQGHKSMLAPLNAQQVASTASVVDREMVSQIEFRSVAQQIDRAILDGDIDSPDVLLAISEAATRPIYNVTSDLAKQLEVPRLIDREGRLARATMEQLRNELQNDMQQLWFAGAVHERVTKMEQFLEPYGLVVSQEYFRQVVNNVARQRLPMVSAEAGRARGALQFLRELRDKLLDTSLVHDGVEGRAMIRESIDRLYEKEPSLMGVISRHGGEGTFSDVREKFIRLGGADGRSGEFKTLNAERRAAGLTQVNAKKQQIKKIVSRLKKTADDAPEKAALYAELDVERQALALLEKEQANVEKAAGGLILNTQRLKKEREDFIENVLKPLYKQYSGDTAKSPSVATMDAFLKSMTDVAGVHWSDEGSTLAQQVKWLDGVLMKVGDGSRRTRRMADWLSHAADPYVNAMDIVVNPKSREMLPSTWASYLDRYADRLSSRLDDLEAKGVQIADAEARQADAVTAHAVAQTRADNLSGPKALTPELWGEQVPEAAGARRAFRELERLRGSEQYALAVQRRGEFDVMEVLARAGIPEGEGVLQIGSANRSLDQALAALDEGDKVFIKQVVNKGEPNEVTDFVEVSAEWLRANKPTETLYRSRAASIGRNDVSEFNRVDFLQRKAVRERSVLEERLRNLKPVDRKRASIEAFNQEKAALQRKIDNLSKDWTDLAAAKKRALEPLDTTIETVMGVDKAPLTFTSNELESIFRGPLMKSERSTLEMQRNRLVEMRAKLVRQAEAGGAPNEAALAELQKQIDWFDNELRIYSPEVQQAAMDKVRHLRQMIKQGKIDLDQLGEGTIKTISAKTEDRLSYINDMWTSTNDAKVLQRFDELDTSAQVAFARTKMNDAAHLQRQRDRVVAEAEMLRKQQGNIITGQQRINNLTGQEMFGDKGYAVGVQDIEGAIGSAYAGATAAVGRPLSEFMSAIPEGDVVTQGRAVVEGARSAADAARAAKPEIGNLVEVDPQKAAILARQKNRGATKIQYGQRRVLDRLTEFANNTKAVEGLERQVDEITKEIDSALTKWTGERTQALAEGRESVVSATQRVNDLHARLVDVSNRLDQARVIKDGIADMPTVKQLRKQIDAIQSQIDKVGQRMDGSDLAALGDWMDETVALLDSLPPTAEIDATRKLLLKHQAALPAVLADKRELDLAKAMLRPNPDGTFFWEKVERDVLEGWKSLEDMGLPNTQMREELYGMLQNMRRMNQPAMTRELAKFMGGYTKFFKAYATLSPGFHVRNAMSNTFMLVAAGADARLFRRSFNMARAYMEAHAAGTLEEFFGRMNAEERAVFDAVLKAADATGGGRVADAMVFRQFGKKNLLHDNAALRASERVGHQVEFTSRFMLSYDTIVQGMKSSGAVRTAGAFTPDELIQTAAARVRKYLFDYADVGVADEAIRNIIPFWTWMSRNLPLQIVNQWQNPRAYAIYNSLMRNLGMNEDGDIVPSWLKEQGAAKVATDWYLAPDLGFNRVQQQTAELGDPARMASYVNPMLRLPIELLGKRRLYNDVPFSDKPQEVSGGPAQPLLEALLSLAGQTQTNAKGETVVDPKVNYALMNLIPILSQAERLAPATDPYQARQAGSWLSYFGVPMRQVTDQMRESEVARRQAELEKMQRAAKNLGFTP